MVLMVLGHFAGPCRHGDSQLTEVAFFGRAVSQAAGAPVSGIYATLGVFLTLAARDPLANLSLIWFTVWSSVVHGGIMTVQAFTQPAQRGHLAGDVPALFIVAASLAILTRWSRGTRVVALLLALVLGTQREAFAQDAAWAQPRNPDGVRSAAWVQRHFC